jgi:hypothetical protein
VGGIAINGTASVTLLPGVYFMQGGGFTVSGKGSVTDNGAGVLLVNAPAGPGDVISITSHGSVSLTASSALTGSLAPYNHIVIFQDPASANTVTVTGQANLTVSGTLYAPAALLQIGGNGVAVVNTDTNPTGGQVIVFDAKIVGNGALTINADPPASAAATVSTAVSVSDNSLRQAALMLEGGQHSSGPIAAPSAVAGMSRSAAAPAAAELAYLFHMGGPAALSGAAESTPPDYWLAPGIDPLAFLL